MQIFQAGGRDWTLAVDVPAIVKVRAACKVDIGARDCSQFERLTSDAVLAAEVLWVLVEEQASKSAVTKDAFFRMLDGDEGEAATVSLLEAVIDFFPKRQRDLLRSTLAKHLEAQELVNEAAAKRLSEQVTVETLAARGIAEMHRELDRVLGITSAN